MSGLVFAATFLISSWMATVWGKFADRHGRKLVLLFLSAGMGTTMALMGIVTNVYELVVLRFLQGFFAGYVSNTSALMASMIPKEKTLPAKQLLKQLQYPSLIIGLFVTTLIVQAANNSISPVISLYVQQLLHHHGNVNLMSGLVAALPGIATLIAAPRFGAWGDRIGTQKILIGGLIFATLVYIPQAFVNNVWVFAGLRFLVGISDAALLPQVQSLLARYTPGKYSGRIFSYNQAAQFSGNIVGPLLGSTVSGVFGYGGVFLSTAALEFINLVWVRHSTLFLFMI